MRHILLIVSAMFMTLAYSGMATAQVTERLLKDFNVAEQEGDMRRATRAAMRLLRSDFSDAPMALTPLEVRELKMEVAQTLWNKGEIKPAYIIIEQLIAEDEAAINAIGEGIRPIENIALQSAIRGRLADRYIMQAELLQKWRDDDAALKAYQNAHRTLTAIYGLDKDRGQVRSDNMRNAETDPVVTKIKTLPTDVLKGYVGFGRGHQNIAFVTSDITERLHQRAKVKIERGQLEAALSDFYIARYYIRQQCGSGVSVSNTPCAEGVMTISARENAQMIAQQWRSFAAKVMGENPLQAYVALDEAEQILRAQRIENDPLLARVTREKARARQAYEATGGRIRPTTYMTQTVALSVVQPNFETIRVFYGTNRALWKPKNPDKTFNRHRGTLSYGSIEMTVPKNRAVGEVPRPGLFDFGGAKDGVHIVLKRVDRKPDVNSFAAELRTSVLSSPRAEKEAFVFVHGHGVSFADSARRAAQLAIDLDIRTGGTFFSWPAGSVATGYAKSENEARIAAEHLETFLTVMAENSGADKIHLIAHSMGNRILLEALEDIDGDIFEQESPAFEQVIWASPDVDADLFSRKIPEVSDKARGMTLYASQFDRALQLSGWLHGSYPRAGQAPPLSPVTNAITTVDTSEFDRGFTDVIAHGDYASSAIMDLRGVVWLSLAPDSRCILSTPPETRHWSAIPKPDCPDTEYRLALNEIRTHGSFGANTQVQRKIDAAAAEQSVPEMRQWQTVKAILETYISPG